jgi:hypothetical protein
LVWAGCKEFGLGVDGMSKLVASFSDFVRILEDTVHCAVGAEIGSLVE